MKALILALARCSIDDVNATVSARDHRTSLHLACAMGNLAMAQLLIWVSFQKSFYPKKTRLILPTFDYYFIVHRIMQTSNKLITKDVHVYHMPKQHFH